MDQRLAAELIQVARGETDAEGTEDVVEICSFTNLDGTGQIHTRRSYYLTPLRQSREDYNRLRLALGSASRIGIARSRIQGEWELGLLFAHAKILVLDVIQTLASPTGTSRSAITCA